MTTSESVEDYLKAIYQLQEEQAGEPVSTTSLAARLGVASASVTGMLKRLASADPCLVVYRPYAGVTLSPEGTRAALEIIRHHRLIESYLNQVLGYSWDEVHAEADRLEHHISEAMEERLAEALGHPLVDPHGDPIPDREGNLLMPETVPLAEWPVDRAAIVQRITGQEPEVLRYLAVLGLVPGTVVVVRGQAPFGGPVTAAVEGREAVALSRELAGKILLVPASAPEREDSHGA